ncbi:MAG: DUF362 domain-containing protein [Planctomycetia bacterium]|nr:DUF362 domain-containing protein [Planctomycetia bacterium]
MSTVSDAPGAAPNAPESSAARLDRRALLIGAGAATVGAIGYSLLASALAPRCPVFLAKGQRYDGPLRRTIQDGLLAAGLDPAALRDRKVLLKPNLVEPSRRLPHMTTHPAVVIAAAEVFRGFGARVTVGEAPGHVRDTQMALAESGLGEALASARFEFDDLNYDDLAWVPNAGRASPLDGFYFPASVVEADLIVSIPKLKTHHWVGMTASMKNLYGVLPGIQYGWPKNVLHHAGIPQTVFDINASLAKSIAIVDGIECMEGDGPILGSPKPLGLLAIGLNPTAVDATCARIMGLEPRRISYLKLAKRLGPIDEAHIPQHGEPWRDLASPFTILDVPHLQELRTRPGVLTS